MRFLHLADLHLGKVVHGVSMLENGDQPAWVDRLFDLADRVRPDAVVIAGDLYDRSSPAAEAVELCSRMVTGLADRNIPVLMIAGNHDSGGRIAFARDVLARQQVHIAGRLQRELTRVTLTDAHGPVTFWLLPYVFPALVAQVLEQDDLRSYDGAVRALLAAQPIDPQTRNILVAHQNVVSGGVEAPRGGSESMVGGVGQIEASAFDDFDYVALGHIHSAYAVGRPEVRYAGSPLCYHFDELRQPRKGPVLVTLGEKGTPVTVETLTIPPLHTLRELRGPYEELRDALLADTAVGEYWKLTLTDRPMSPEVSAFFQSLADARDCVLMERGSEYRRFSAPEAGPSREAMRETPVEALFSGYYAQRRGGETPSARDEALLRQAGELVRNNDPDPKRRGQVSPKAIEALTQFLLGQEDPR